MQLAELMSRQLALLSDQLEAAMPAALALSHSEAIHDLRVRLRRLREALRFAAPPFPRDFIKPIRQGLSHTAGATDALRDVEAQEELVRSAAERAGVALPEHWLAIQQEQRRHLEHAVVKTLADSELRRLIAQVRALTILPPLRKAMRSAEAHARDALANLLSRARQAVLHAREAPHEENRWHELRLDCKRLRYVGEFFEAALPEKDLKLIRRAKRMQAILGDLRDLQLLEARLQLDHDIDVPTLHALRAEFQRRRGRLLLQRDQRLPRLLGQGRPKEPKTEAAPVAPPMDQS